MKSRFLALLLVLAMAAMMLTSCSLFTTEGGNSGDNENSGNSENNETGGSTDIQITDKYTFKNPDGLEYEKRYVVYYSPDSPLVSSAVSAGYGMKETYSILYADANDAPLKQFDFIICNSEDDAGKVAEFYLAQGQTLTAVESDPCVLTATTEGEVLAATLASLQSMGGLSDATVSAFVEWNTTSSGGVLK